HLGKFAPDNVPLEWIVVCENKRVRANVETLRDHAQVRSFIPPIGNKSCDVGARDEHLRMTLERQQGVCLVILGTDRQDHPATSLIQHPALELDVGLAQSAALPEGDPFQPVISNYPAPQGVVQIENQAF